MVSAMATALPSIAFQLCLQLSAFYSALANALENAAMVASFLEKDQWSLVFQVQDTAQFIYK